MKIKIAIILLISIASFGAGSTNPNEKLNGSLGFILGNGSPSGNGIEGSYFLNQRINVTGGFGLSMAGYKWGAGSQYFFLEENRFSHYLGLSATISSGAKFYLDDHIPGEGPITSVYKMNPGISMNIRTGIRYAFNWANFYTNFGYGFVITGSEIEYVSGQLYTETPYEKFRPKGIEFSMGLRFRVSKRK